MNEKKDTNGLLLDAISQHDVQEVERLLQSGADPNFKLSAEEYKGMSDYKHQPYSPLRLVVFIISDALATDVDLEKDYETASVLLKYGADAQSAMELAELRYGKYSSDIEITPFTRVLQLINDAIK